MLTPIGWVRIHGPLEIGSTSLSCVVLFLAFHWRPIPFSGFFFSLLRQHVVRHVVQVMGPDLRRLGRHRTTRTQKKRNADMPTFMQQVWYEPTMPVFEQYKTVHTPPVTVYRGALKWVQQLHVSDVRNAVWIFLHSWWSCNSSFYLDIFVEICLDSLALACLWRQTLHR